MKDLKEAFPTPESIIGCESCPFKTKKIGGRGPFDSPFVIVGESPGSTELNKNVPFVGPSGQMIKSVLEEVGFDELGVEPYITNALSCYPMDKTIPKMQAATSCCQGRLHQELLAHPREVILCLGASATWAVTGDYKLAITRDRGKVLKSNYASKGVVLAVHPAYLIRNGGGLPFWKKDLSSAVKLMAGTLETRWNEPTWSVVDSRKKLVRLVKEYKAAKYIAADYETDGLSSIFNLVLCLGVTKDGNHVDLIDEPTYYGNMDLIKELMEAEGPRWIWQNGKFDIQFSWQTDVQARVDEDTMLASYALNENQGFHDLDQIAQTWIQAPAHKGVMDKYYKEAPHYSLRNAPPEQLYKYCAFDLAKTFKVFFPLEEALQEDERLLRLYRHTLIRATPFFARIERYGVLIDRSKVEENIAEEDRLLEAIEAKLQSYAQEHMQRNINFGSYIQVRELLWKHMKLGPPNSWKGATWREIPSDEDALIDAQRRTNHPILHDLLEHREIKKRRGTYVANLIDQIKRHPA